MRRSAPARESAQQLVKTGPHIRPATPGRELIHFPRLVRHGLAVWAVEYVLLGVGEWVELDASCGRRSARGR